MIFRTSGEVQKKLVEETLEVLKILEEHAFGPLESKYFGGDKMVNIVDLAYGVMGYWLDAIEDCTGVKVFDPVKFPCFHGWIVRFNNAPIIRDNLPDREEMFANFKHRREMILSATSKMAMDEVKVHGMNKSPYYWRVAWTLKLKGVSFEFVEEDISNKSPLLLQYNPIYNKVPVLVHGGKPICESSVIMEYIDETWSHHNKPLMPVDPYARSIARFWIKFADDQSSKLWRVALTSGEEREEAIKECLELLQIIEEKAGLCENNNFFNGDEIGIVDLAFSGIGYWLGLIESSVGVKMMDSHKFPRLFSWATNFREHPVIKANTPFEL
ncbi:Probable glutathione S-transferase [Linum perenne]